jgi:hypothetical protein
LTEIKNLLGTYILPSMALLALDLANGVKRNDFRFCNPEKSQLRQ